MTERVYRPLPALNWSRFKHCITSAIEARDREDHPRTDPKKTNLGGAQHSLTLTPEEFPHEYAIVPAGMSLARKDGKAWKAEQLLEGRRTLSTKEGATLYRADRGIRRSKEARYQLEHAHKEQVAIWYEDGICFKQKMDFWLDRGDGLITLTDLKGDDDPDLHRWLGRRAAPMWLHGQMAFYAHGLEQALLQSGKGKFRVDRCQWLVHDAKTGETCPILCPDAALDAGDILWRRAVKLWIESEEANDWPGRWDDSDPIDVTEEWPAWADGMLGGNEIETLANAGWELD